MTTAGVAHDLVRFVGWMLDVDRRSGETIAADGEDSDVAAVEMCCQHPAARGVDRHVRHRSHVAHPGGRHVADSSERAHRIDTERSHPALPAVARVEETFAWIEREVRGAG